MLVLRHNDKPRTENQPCQASCSAAHTITHAWPSRLNLANFSLIWKDTVFCAPRDASAGAPVLSRGAAREQWLRAARRRRVRHLPVGDGPSGRCAAAALSTCLSRGMHRPLAWALDVLPLVPRGGCECERSESAGRVIAGNSKRVLNNLYTILRPRGRTRTTRAHAIGEGTGVQNSQNRLVFSLRVIV